MANEASVLVSLTLTPGNQDWQSKPTAYSYDVSGSKGPSPGSLVVPAGGKIVDLSQLTEPGPCIMRNLHDTDPVDVGIRDPDNGRFYPLIELQPGNKPQYVYLSRNLLEEFSNTGTGTVAGNQLFLLPQGSSDCTVVIEAFDR